MVPEQREEAKTARLIECFQSGDREAFAEIYGLWFGQVFNYLRVVLKDRHEAEDLAQQVFLQIHQALPGYQQRGRPFRHWLLVVMRNVALNHLRQTRRIELTEPDELSNRRGRQDNGEPALDALQWISDSDLLIFVERLPLSQRQVLAMRYLLDLTNTEVAEILDRTPDETKMLHYRAMTFLRARLAAVGRTGTRRERSGLQRRHRQAEVLRARRWALVE